MLLKTVFILGDIGFYSQNLFNLVGYIKNDIQKDDIITLVGDNFYPSGVDDINDSQWKKYEDIFKDVTNPKYCILGNHDYMLNPKAQIESENWQMDDWYFKKEFENVDLYFLDTNQFSISNWVPIEKLEEIHGIDSENLIKRQISWLEMELSKNLNKKKIVFGHYPIITNGKYKGRMDKLYNDLIDTFTKFKVNLYISGHEHNIQFLKRDFGFNFNQIIIGSSSENRDDANQCLKDDMLDNSDSYYGKLLINPEEDSMTIQYLNTQNKVIYQYILN